MATKTVEATGSVKIIGNNQQEINLPSISIYENFNEFIYKNEL